MQVVGSRMPGAGNNRRFLSRAGRVRTGTDPSVILAVVLAVGPSVVLAIIRAVVMSAPGVERHPRAR